MLPTVADSLSQEFKPCHMGVCADDAKMAAMLEPQWTMKDHRTTLAQRDLDV